MDHNAAVVVTNEIEASSALVRWVLSNFEAQLHECGIVIIHIRPRIRCIKSSIGEVPLSIANENMVKVHLEDECRKAEELCRHFQHLCEEHQVPVKTVQLATSPSAGKALVRQILELRARTVYIHAPPHKGLRGIFPKYWSTPEYLRRHAPKSCRVNIVSDLNQEISNSGSLAPRASDSSFLSDSLFSISPSESSTPNQEDIQQPRHFSLDDWINHKDGAPSLLWHDAIHIALEVATALNSMPLPLPHGILKPSNILLSGSNLCKLSDNGHGLIDARASSDLAYIDPESPYSGDFDLQSDIFSFGIVLLQVLSRKAASGLYKKFEEALRVGSLETLLDPDGHWPLEFGKQVAALALYCAQARADDRPNLEEEVLPTLNRFWRDSKAKVALGLDFCESSLRCKLTGDVMEDPVSAMDGHTYEKVAIEDWLLINDVSPVTGEQLESKQLTRNDNIHRLILEWRAKIAS